MYIYIYIYVCVCVYIYIYIQLALTEKIEDFIKRLRWRTLFYLEPQEDNNCAKKELYNLKSQNTPPNNRLLDPFEADLFGLIKKVKFKRENNNFQMKLSRDIIIIIISCRQHGYP